MTAPAAAATDVNEAYFTPDGVLTKAGEDRRDRIFGIYTVANGMSFNLVSASFVVMYAIAYGADATYTGMLWGCINMSMAAGFLSLFLLAIFGASKLMGYAWSSRYIFAVGLLFTPWVAAQPAFGAHDALTLIFLCVLGFSVFRAIGASAWLPLIHTMTTQENRIAFMTGNSFRFRIGAGVGIVGAIAFLAYAGKGGQGDGDPALLWWVILAGVLIGLIGTTCLFRLPQQKTGLQPAPRLSELRAVAATFWRRASMRYFFFSVLLMMAAIGLFQAQRVYYLRKVIDLSVTDVAWIDAVTMVGAGALLFPLRRLAWRHGEMPVLRVTLVAMIVVGASFGSLPSNRWLVGASLLVWNTGLLWVYLSTDRTMLGECDQQSSKVLPVIWSSTKDFTMGFASMGSGFIVDAIAALKPGWTIHQHYWLFDNGVMLLLGASLVLLTWTLRTHPLRAAASSLEPATAAASAAPAPLAQLAAPPAVAGASIVMAASLPNPTPAAPQQIAASRS